MRLVWLELRDFRCYEELRFEPAPGLNILVGANGSGKTSVLEGIVYLSKLRSLRGDPDAALIRIGAGQAVDRGGFVYPAGERRIEVEIPTAGRRRVLRDGKRPGRLRDLAAEIPVVTFLPDDLDLVKRGPGHRRDYLDDLVAMASPAGGADLDEYLKVLRQRNALLRQGGIDTDLVTLEVWDRRLAETGARVLVRRIALMHALGPRINDALRHLGEPQTVRWDYRASWLEGRLPADLPGWEAALADALRRRRRRDLEQRTTTTGPHRDDPALVLGDREARTQASQGEQRSLALALRVASFRLLEEEYDKAPLLALDDVFSELDVDRAAAVAGLLPDAQVFVTTARHDEVPAKGARWVVRDGKVMPDG